MSRVIYEADLAGPWTLEILAGAVVEVIDDAISWIKRTITAPWVPKVIELLLNELELLKRLVLILQNIGKDGTEPLGPYIFRSTVIKCGDLVIELGDSFIDSADNSLEYISGVQYYRGEFIRLLSREDSLDPGGGLLDLDKVPVEYPSLLALLTEVGGTPGSKFPGQSHKIKALHDAASQGNLLAMKELLKENDFDIKETDRDGMTALHIATARGHKPGVELLLGRFNRSGISAVDEQGRTALHIAICQGDQEIIHMLLKKHINLSAKTKDGLTALHLAAHFGNRETVSKLLYSGVQVSPKNCYNATPLHLAAAGGFKQVVKLLCLRGADLSALTVDKFSPLHMAVKFGRALAVEFLLTRNINITDADENANVALYIALNYGHLTIASLIMNNREKLSATGAYKSTALYIAIYKGYASIAQRLIEGGASLSIHGVLNKPLYFGAWIRMEDVVKALLERGLILYQLEQKQIKILLL